MAKGMGNPKRWLMRHGNLRRGETLVETIVAFAVLLLLLGMVTTVVQGAIRLNNHAQDLLAELAGACETVETMHLQGSLTPTYTSTLRLEYQKKANESADYSKTETIRVYNAQDTILHSFYWSEDGGE